MDENLIEWVKTDEKKAREDFKKVRNNGSKPIEMSGDALLKLDPRRQVNELQRMIIWNKADTHNNFDPVIFKHDYMGNVSLYRLTAKNTKNYSFRRRLAYDFEHLIPYSKGGATDTVNVVLLNSGVNMSKGNRRDLSEMEFYEFQGYTNRFGMRFSDLENDLIYDLHGTCIKYDMIFIRSTSGYWSVATDNFNNYSYYNDCYKYNKRPITVVIHPVLLDPAVVAILASATIVVSTFLWKWIRIWNKKIKDFIKEKKIKKLSSKIDEKQPLIEEIREVCHDIGLVIYGFLINQNHLFHENKLHREQNKKNKN
jgi:hypothetical protein